MRGPKRRGNTLIEFCLVMVFFLLPMMLFTYAIGFNLLMQLEVVQLCRDAGHLYVTLNYGQTVSLSDPLFTSVLAQIGASAGYPSNAEVIFSKIVYVDSATCALGGGTGSPPSCANSGQWVYEQYYSTGTKITGFTPAPNLATPSGGTGTGTCGLLAPGCGAVDSQGTFNTSDSVSKPGLTVGSNFSQLGISSYNPDTATGLPSGQAVFLVQVGATPFNVTGVVSLVALNDYAVF